MWARGIKMCVLREKMELRWSEMGLRRCEGVVKMCVKVGPTCRLSKVLAKVSADAPVPSFCAFSQHAQR